MIISISAIAKIMINSLLLYCTLRIDFKKNQKFSQNNFF
jgi:hypothetical protein